MTFLDILGFFFFFFMKTKAEARSGLETFVKLIQTQSNKTVKVIRSDYGQEFKMNEEQN